ncbi:MAG TPA: acyl-CoA dehydrogenase family protein [Kofleriaceae bacterium]|nr:acyl-CoA dehydrogenase family protein [Kofleriaceae bacterium]
MDALLRLVLAPDRAAASDSLDTWWAATGARRAAWDASIDRAIAAGALADRVGFAFAAGYGEALRALVGDRVPDGLHALCATEESGNHPRAIKTALTPLAGGGFELTGKKKWATAAPNASALLVVATTGDGPDGKPRLRVVRVPASAPGVRLTSSAAPFVPEIPHAEIELDHVRVSADDVLPGDGYDDYLKPFRTVEDLHVHAALLAYLIGVARVRRFPHELVEQLLASIVAVRALGLADPRAATTHLALAGVLAAVHDRLPELERPWAVLADDEWRRWERDRAILRVASAARTARRDRAWEAIGS